MNHAVNAVVLSAALSVGCSMFGGGSNAKSFRLTASPAIPAAAGMVSLSKGENGNTGFAVHVKHLARPTLVTPGAVTYVVWVQPRATPNEMVAPAAPPKPEPAAPAAAPAPGSEAVPGQPAIAQAPAPRPATQGPEPVQPMNVGGLVVDKELNGRLIGQTAFREFDIFVTAEAEASVTKPNGTRLLWAQVRQ